MADYDVIVVGAGPSGSTAARGCAKAGLKTLILDREKLPRFKACGGGVTVKVDRIIDYKIPEEIIERKAYGVRLNYWNKSNSHLREYPITNLVSRSRFDKFLADKTVEAGAELMDGTIVSSVSKEGSTQTVESSEGKFTAKMIVGADGVNSIVSERVRPRLTQDELASTIEAEVPMSPEEIDVKFGNFLDVYFGNSVGIGYGWIFPKNDHISVGVGSLLRMFKNPKQRFIEFLGKMKLPLDVELHPHLIPLGNPKRRVVSDGIILVGDAAGYADPLTGEGIYSAIHSGKLASETIVQAFDKNNFKEEFLSTYHTECRSAFSEEFRRARKAAWVIYGMPFISYPLIIGNKEVLEKYVDILAGETTYKAFKQWAQPKLPSLLLKGLLGR
ncbi:MAG: NAD(P)/FAD-dependent oxidoreductase [Candidatus Altiarchaeota archaeon]|nr:NAD(P)/FAD-dependent oxidoreductase [Candidatus Altiarchaeota archaeon]